MEKSKIFKDIRLKLGLSQPALSKEIHRSEVMVSYYENNYRGTEIPDNIMLLMKLLYKSKTGKDYKEVDNG